MPYRQKHHKDIDVFETVYTGTMSAADLQKAIDEGNEFHRESGVEKFLADATDMELAADIFELYDLPRQYEDFGVKRSSRMAVVIPKSPETKNLAEFYETVCRNRFWRVRLFETREEAITWLSVDDPSPP